MEAVGGNKVNNCSISCKTLPYSVVFELSHSEIPDFLSSGGSSECVVMDAYHCLRGRYDKALICQAYTGPQGCEKGADNSRNFEEFGGSLLRLTRRLVMFVR